MTQQLTLWIQTMQTYQWGMKFSCTQHQGQYLHVFVQLACGAAGLSLGGSRLA